MYAAATRTEHTSAYGTSIWIFNAELNRTFYAHVIFDWPIHDQKSPTKVFTRGRSKPNYRRGTGNTWLPAV